MLGSKEGRALKESAIGDGPTPRLQWHPAPRALGPWVLGFVERDEPAPPTVQRLLPELRASLQVHHGAPFWLRQAGAPWVQAPRVALWRPRVGPCLGHAEGRVQAFALGLSACGLRALLPGPALPGPGHSPEVVDLALLHAPLAQLLDRQGGEDFATWCARVQTGLARLLQHAALPDRLDRASEALLLEQVHTVAECAALAGLSERQFRRRFAQRHGVAPKAYQRLVRVDRLLRRLHARPWEADPGPLHEEGFADQAHAIRAFRAVTGMTPGAYQRLKQGGELSLRSVSAPHEDPPPPR